MAMKYACVYWKETVLPSVGNSVFEYGESWMLRQAVTHSGAFIAFVLIDGAGRRGCGRLAGGRRRGGVSNVGSGHVHAQLSVELGLVDGGQLVPRHHPIGIVHADDGPHHHGRVGGVLAEVGLPDVLQHRRRRTHTHEHKSSQIIPAACRHPYRHFCPTALFSSQSWKKAPKESDSSDFPIATGVARPYIITLTEFRAIAFRRSLAIALSCSLPHPRDADWNTVLSAKGLDT